jgi:hypothetical protein
MPVGNAPRADPGDRQERTRDSGASVSSRVRRENASARASFRRSWRERWPRPRAAAIVVCILDTSDWLRLPAAYAAGRIEAGPPPDRSMSAAATKGGDVGRAPRGSLKRTERARTHPARSEASSARYGCASSVWSAAPQATPCVEAPGCGTRPVCGRLDLYLGGVVDEDVRSSPARRRARRVRFRSSSPSSSIPGVMTWD